MLRIALFMVAATLCIGLLLGNVVAAYVSGVFNVLPH